MSTGTIKLKPNADAQFDQQLPEDQLSTPSETPQNNKKKAPQARVERKTSADMFDVISDSPETKKETPKQTVHKRRKLKRRISWGAPAEGKQNIPSVQVHTVPAFSLERDKSYISKSLMDKLDDTQVNQHSTSTQI